MKNKIITLILLVCFLYTGSAYAQTGTPEDLAERAELIAENEKLKAQNEAKDVKIAILEDTIKQYKELDSLQEKRIFELKSAIDARKEAEIYTAKIELLYTERLSDYKIENQRLRDENYDLRKSKNRNALFTIAAVVAGILILK